MPLNLTVSDVELVNLTISTAQNGGLTLVLNADWLALDDAGGVVTFVEQKKDSESKLFSAYPQAVQDAVIALNDYAINRIKAAYGI